VFNLSYTSVPFRKSFDYKAKGPTGCNTGESFCYDAVLVRPQGTGFGALPNYRLYRLDGAGKITSAEWIEASADDHARAEAASRCDSGSFELWEKSRLIERFRPHSGPAPRA